MGQGTRIMYEKDKGSKDLFFLFGIKEEIHKAGSKYKVQFKF